MVKQIIIVGRCLELCKGPCGRFLTNDIKDTPYHVLEYQNSGICVDCFRLKEIMEDLKKITEKIVPPEKIERKSVK
jgi:hypothetical protein